MKSVVVHHFWNPTCGPCKAVKPALNMLAEEFADSVTWVSVNTHDDKQGYKDCYAVTAVPTIVVVVRDESGKDVHIEKHSGTSIAGYYRIVRNCIGSKS